MDLANFKRKLTPLPEGHEQVVRVRVDKYSTPKFNELCTVVKYEDEDGYVSVRLWGDNMVWLLLPSDLEYLHSIDELVPTVRSQMRSNLRRKTWREQMKSISHVGTL